MRGLRDKDELFAEIADDGSVMVEKHFVGRLRGFEFSPDANAEGIHGKAARNAAAHVLTKELAMRARRVASAKSDAFKLTRQGRVLWRDEEIARVDGTENVLRPTVTLIAGKQIPSYRCPSALNTDVTAWGFATASYAGSYSVGDGWGFFSLEGVTRRLGDVTDGLSYTIAVGEAGAYRPGSGYSPTHVQQPAWFASPTGYVWSAMRHVDYYRLRGPNGPRDDAMTSGHPGGVHVLAGDGAVHFMDNGMNLLVYTSLGTIRPFVNTTLNATSSDANWQYAAANWAPGLWKPNATTSSNWDEIQSSWDE